MKVKLIILGLLLSALSYGQIPVGVVASSVDAAPDYSAYNQYTQDYLNAMTVPWTGDTIGEIDYMIDSLDNDGYLDSMYVFYMFASTSSGDALLNLIQDSSAYDADLASTAPTFTRLKHFQGDASDDIISTNFIPSTAGLPQDRLTVGVGIADNQQENEFVYGTHFTNGIRFRPRTASDVAYAWINSDNSSSSSSVTSSIGHWYISRSVSTTQLIHYNGSQLDSESISSTGLADEEFHLMEYNGDTDRGDNQIVYWFVMKGGIDATQAEDIKEDIEGFLDYIDGGIE